MRLGQDMGIVEGKIAAITASTRGIGLACAKRLAGEGAKVYLAARNQERAQGVIDQIREAGGMAEFVRFDAADQETYAGFVNDVVAREGRIDILVNNAGIIRREPFTEHSAKNWNDVISINLSTPFFLSQAVARQMVKQGQGGKIINIGSLTCEAARATVAPYTAAKGGIKMLTRSMAAEWAKYNIQANTIGPGYILTEMNTALIDNPEFDAWVKSSNPAGRWGNPDELAGTAVYLASAASNYVNGQIIYVDGGWLAVL